MPTDAQLFACGAYATDSYGDCYAPPAVKVRREAAPRLRDLLPRTPDVQGARRRLALLLGDAPPDLRISAFGIGGRFPNQQQVDAIAAELRRAPAKALADFHAQGGEVHVVPLGMVQDHPVSRLFPRRPVHGRCVLSSRSLTAPLIIVDVGGSADATGTPLHELGHFVDRGFRISSRPEWQRMAADATRITCLRYPFVESDGGCLAGLVNARKSPEEAFCEAFAIMYYSERTRQHLPADIRRFITETTG